MKRWRFYVTADGGDVVRKELADLEAHAKGAILETMSRARRDELFPYEHETIGRGLQAIRVFHDGNTYRVLYAPLGKHDRVLLALHVLHKKDRKLPTHARRLAERRLRDWRDRG